MSIPFRLYAIHRYGDEQNIRRQSDAHKKRHQEKKAAKRFEQVTGYKPDRQNGNQLWIDNVILLYDNRGFRVEGQCKHCKTQVWSIICHSIEAIGKQLNRFQSDMTEHPNVECDWLRRENTETTTK